MECNLLESICYFVYSPWFNLKESCFIALSMNNDEEREIGGCS